ncbi:MAG: hypothetical protein ACOYLH_07190 [Flavobacteriales bacterium]
MRIQLILTAFLFLFCSLVLRAQETKGFYMGATSLIAPKGFQNPYFINGAIRPSCGVFWRKQLTEKSQFQVGLQARMTSFKRYIYNPPQYTYRDPIIYKEYSLFTGVPIEGITQVAPRIHLSYGFETLFNIYSMQRGQRYETGRWNTPGLVDFHQKSPNESLVSIAPFLGVVLPMTDNWEAFIKCGYSLNNYFKEVTDEDNMHFLSLTIGISRNWLKKKK